MSILFLISVYILKLHTFIASTITLLIVIFYIYIKRKDLIKNSIYSGILITIIAIPSYLITELITPGWIITTWNTKTLSGISLLKIPIEDLIWFFLSGCLIGPLYEFLKNKKLTNKIKS
jgi:4-hydroxybenzoate polyprenyltransferase